MFERGIAHLFRMTDATWKRHASPWSVWTRVLTLPLLVLAIWSRVWFGWAALVPVGVVALWIWLNPRIFPPPRSTDNWASKATFGERVWLARGETPIPPHHARAARVLSGLAGVGTVVLAVGLVLLDLTLTVGGATFAWLAKLWFCDRMVWLYDDMRDANPTYRAWLY